MQHLRHFGGFEMNKGDLGRQREGRILVAEKKFFTKLMFVVWLRVQNAAQEIRRNRGILNRVPLLGLQLALQTMAGILSNFFDVSFYDFTHNYSLFTNFNDRKT
jgi:heme A synthase